MKLILSQDVDKLGARGEIVEVKAGYARNFLLPQNIAHVATADNIEMVNRRIAKLQEVERVEKENAAALSQRIAAMTLSITAKSGQDDKLFGSVTAHEIVDLIKGKGIELDKSAVHLSESIRKLGEHVVEVKLGYGEVAKLKISVVKE